MTVKSKCVHCGAEVGEWTQDCPKCGRPVANKDAPIVSDLKSRFKYDSGLSNRKTSTSYLLAVIAVVILAVIIYLMKF